VVIIGSFQDAQRLSSAFSIILNVLGPAEASEMTVPHFLIFAFLCAAGESSMSNVTELSVRVLHSNVVLVIHGPYPIVPHTSYASVLMCIPGSWRIITATSFIMLSRQSMDDNRFDRSGLERNGTEKLDAAGGVQARAICSLWEEHFGQLCRMGVRRISPGIKAWSACC
jgi:hypothetical protein